MPMFRSDGGTQLLKIHQADLKVGCGNTFLVFFSEVNNTGGTKSCMRTFGGKLSWRNYQKIQKKEVNVICFT